MTSASLTKSQVGEASASGRAVVAVDDLTDRLAFVAPDVARAALLRLAEQGMTQWGADACAILCAEWIVDDAAP